MSDHPKSYSYLQYALGLLQDEVYHWSKRNFPNNEPNDPFMGVVEEVGELAHALLKTKQGIRGDQTEKIKDSVGDIVVYLADFCARNNIDLGHIVACTWSQVSQRDWVNNNANGEIVVKQTAYPCIP